MSRYAIGMESLIGAPPRIRPSCQVVNAWHAVWFVAAMLVSSCGDTERKQNEALAAITAQLIHKSETERPMQFRDIAEAAELAAGLKHGELRIHPIALLPLCFQEWRSDASPKSLNDLKQVFLHILRRHVYVNREEFLVVFNNIWHYRSEGDLDDPERSLWQFIDDPHEPADARIMLMNAIRDVDICGNCCCGCPDISRTLENVLHDGSVDVVLSAIRALVSQINKHKVTNIFHGDWVLRAMQSLLALSENSDARVRRAVLEGLQAIIATHGNYTWHVHPALWLGRISFGEMITQGLKTFQHDPDPDIRALASVPVQRQEATFADW